MIITGIPPILAPHSTEQPAPPPQDFVKVAAATRVAPANEGGGTTDTWTGTDRSQYDEAPRRVKRQSAEENRPETAPPTMLQVKINSMLREQAESNKKPEAEIAAAEPKFREARHEPEAAVRKSVVEVELERKATVTKETDDHRSPLPRRPAELAPVIEVPKYEPPRRIGVGAITPPISEIL